MITKFTGLVALTLLACTLVRTQVVPVSEMPQAPPGQGWACFERDRPTKTGGMSTMSSCYRTLEECKGNADGMRSGNPDYVVRSCTMMPRAACTYHWLAGEAARFECRSTMAECQRYLGLPVNDPSDKQTECSELE